MAAAIPGLAISENQDNQPSVGLSFECRTLAGLLLRAQRFVLLPFHMGSVLLLRHGLLSCHVQRVLNARGKVQFVLTQQKKKPLRNSSIAGKACKALTASIAGRVDLIRISFNYH